MMQKEFKRQKKVGSFELTIQSFSELLDELQKQNPNEKISFSIDFKDKNEKISFNEIDALNNHVNELPGKMNNFIIWIRFEKTDNKLLEDNKILISNSGVIIHTAEITSYSVSESWCLSSIAVVDGFLKKQRKWHWFVDYFPPEISIIIYILCLFGIYLNSDKTYYIIAYLLVVSLLFSITLGHNKLFPSMSFIVKQKPKLTESTCNKWMIFFTAISSIAAIISSIKAWL
jgi:hypothetical protein